MCVSKILIGVQLALLLFHSQSLHGHRSSADIATGRRLREDLLWLNEVCDGAVDDLPDALLPKSLPTFRLLTCSEERANSIAFWQMFESSSAIHWLCTSSAMLMKDMLSQYVPEHHNGRTPLQLSASNLAYSLAYEVPDTPQSLETMISLIIASGADLHETYYGYTLLHIFLGTLRTSHCRYDAELPELRPRHLRRMLKTWLNILQRAGVDLSMYGSEEIHRSQEHRSVQGRAPLIYPWSNWNTFTSKDEFNYFVFSYGPTPDDWTVQFDHMVDEYMGDFWRMLDTQDQTRTRAVPGSWIDD